MIVNLSWNAVPNATSYNVYRSGGPSGFQLIFTTLTANSYVDGPNDLDNSTTYTYQVTSVTGSGESLPSNVVTAVPLGPPLSPTGLTQTVSSGSSSSVPLLPDPANIPTVTVQNNTLDLGPGQIPGSTTYYTKFSWIDGFGGISRPSHEAANGVGSHNGALLVAINETPPTTAVGYNIYICPIANGASAVTLQATVLGFAPHLVQAISSDGPLAPLDPIQGG